MNHIYRQEFTDHIYQQEFTIEIFGRTVYLDGRLAAPDDGNWFELETFSTENEALEYLQAKFPWIGEHKPYSQEEQVEWRIVKTEIKHEVVKTNVSRGLYFKQYS